MFDHHDLCPELYESRFQDAPRASYWGLRILESLTFRSAQHVIATNGSYRRVAIERGHKKAADVTVVSTGPDAERLRRGASDPALRRGRRYLVAYLGVMGPQDGVDNVLRAADLLVHQLGWDDVSFTLVGGGDCFDELVALRDELGLRGLRGVHGRVPDDVVARVLSTADVGLSPDPRNPLNDVSTMNKTMEYMAFGLPVVAFDLVETRVSARRGRRLRASQTRSRLLRQGDRQSSSTTRPRGQRWAPRRRRVESELAWTHQAPELRRRSMTASDWTMAGAATTVDANVGA